MSLSRTNIVLASLLLIVAALATMSKIDYEQPNYEFLPDMKRSPAFHAFEPNPSLPGGRTLQMPVAGTIARGALPLHYTASKKDAARAGEEISNPFQVAISEASLASKQKLPGGKADEAATPDAANGNEAKDAAAKSAARLNKAREQLRASVQRGAAVYKSFCICCHGPKGAGDGPVAQRAVLLRPPSLGLAAQKKDGQLFHILTYGQGRMAPMVAQLSRARRWDVINFVRSLQSSAPVGQPAANAGSTAEVKP